MSFESTAEGRVGVDGADRWRKTVPRVRTADRESPSFELGLSSLYRGWSTKHITYGRGIKQTSNKTMKQYTKISNRGIVRLQSV